MRDHPDIAAALETGYPSGAPTENRDGPFWRMAFLEDNEGLLLKYLLKEEPDVLDRFFERYDRQYRRWLN